MGQADQQLAEVEADRLRVLERHVDGHEAVRGVGRDEQVLGAGVAVRQCLGQSVQAVEQLGHARAQGPQVGPEPVVDGSGDQRVGPDLVPLEHGQPDPRPAVVAQPGAGRQPAGGQQGRVRAAGGEPAKSMGGAGEPGRLPGVVQRAHVLHPYGHAVVAELVQAVQVGQAQARRQPVGEPRLPGSQLPTPGEHLQERLADLGR
jgi:hypothetical protein